MRNASKNKFLTCFRPVVDIDGMLESSAVVERSASHRITCIPVADKHDTKNSVTKFKFSDQECTKLTHNWVVPHPPKRTLNKKTRASNKINGYGQNFFGTKRTYSAYVENSSTGYKKQAFVEANIENAKAPELSSSISSLNSPVSKSKNLSKCEFTKDQLEKQKICQCLGTCLFLISLAITVLWGKINVIILTSLLICLFSHWNANCRWPKEVPKLRNAESKAYNHIGNAGPKERL